MSPRIYLPSDGRHYSADFRPWGGKRTVLRDPKASGRGAKTDDPEVADAWARGWVERFRGAARNAGLGLPAEAPRLGAAVEEWLQERSRVVAHHTYAHSRAWGQRLVKWYGPTARVDSIDLRSLQRHVNAYADRGYQIGTLYHVKHTLGAFFRDKGDGYNPARSLKLPDWPASDANAWTDGELAALRVEAPSALHRLALELALSTGGRKMEIAALRWGDINEAERTVRFTRQRAHIGAGFTALKSRQNRTTLILPSWWEYHKPAGDLILGGLSDWQASVLFGELILAAGLAGPGVGAHRFRHTYSRLFLEMGGWLDELQRSLGHSSIRTTEQTYGHFQTDKAAYFARDRIYGEGRNGGRNICKSL